ncbi:312_t:CDS:2, partial [Entrophospora sp. SA101]
LWDMKNYENKDVSVNQGTWKVEGLVNMIQNLVNQIVIALNNKTKSKQDNIAPSCLTDEIVSLMINLRVYGGISNEFQFVIYAFGIENGVPWC